MSGAGDNTVGAWAASILSLEADIEELQESKREFYSAIREGHGKVAANALKLAVKVHRMDPEKRAEDEQIDAEAERMLRIIESTVARRAPRAREIIEEFDPTIPLTGIAYDAETGEITDTAEPAPQAPAAAPETARTSLSGATQSTGRPMAAAEVTTPEANTHGQTGTADNAGSQPLLPANAEAVAKNVGPSEQNAVIEPPVDTQPTEFERIQAEVVAKTFNRATHFRSSGGFLRLHGCQEPDGCAGSHRELCHTCRRVVEAA